MAWTSEPVPADLLGPWREVRVAAPGLVLIDSDDTLSRVFHELKWSMAAEAALLVAPVSATPKLGEWHRARSRWLRRRISVS